MVGICHLHVGSGSNPSMSRSLHDLLGSSPGNLPISPKIEKGQYSTVGNPVTITVTQAEGTGDLAEELVLTLDNVTVKPKENATGRWRMKDDVVPDYVNIEVRRVKQGYGGQTVLQSRYSGTAESFTIPGVRTTELYGAEWVTYQPALSGAGDPVLEEGEYQIQISAFKMGWRPVYVTKRLLVKAEGLKWLILPEGLREIEEEAFAGGSFEAVYVPDGCQAIGDRAFAGCANLVYVSCPEMTEISTSAFEGCAPEIVTR